jgi:hypothetical protein
MRLRHFILSIPLIPCLACGPDVSLTETSRCDGALQKSEDTVDSPYDEDGDGYFDANNPECVENYPAELLDCDDSDPETFNACDTAVPTDTDEEEDEEEDWSGTWFLGSEIQYGCAFGYVEIAFATVDITHAGSNLLIEGEGTKGQPGKTAGTVDANVFYTDRTITGTCDESYIFEGEFTSNDRFQGSFTAQYTGSACYDCVTQKWDITGER